MNRLKADRMSTVTETLLLTETIAPADQTALAAAISSAHEQGTPVYPLGGGTSLDFGLASTREGIGLPTSGLNRLVDYPARDMTITVEAGMTMARLREVLAAERQWLPIDAPRGELATIGGVVATATCGARRYGYGTVRDYVIGIRAVDGRGRAFQGGGRVVKNVAGYDFCKLLTGSLGTLGVISQVTLKIRPLPEQSAFLVHELGRLADAEPLLAGLVNSATNPAAIELLAGPAWNEMPALGPSAGDGAVRLAVGLEGTKNEVEWMLQKLAAEWRAAGAGQSRAITGASAAELWHTLAEFPSVEAPLVLKASVLPSKVTHFAELICQFDPQASLQVHAGNGIVVARFSRFDAGDVSRTLIGRLQPAARLAGGSAIVLSSKLEGLTHQAVWGAIDAPGAWMEKVKRQFDPKGILNPGRFVYERA